MSAYEEFSTLRYHKYLELSQQLADVKRFPFGPVPVSTLFTMAKIPKVGQDQGMSLQKRGSDYSAPPDHE